MFGDERGGGFRGGGGGPNVSRGAVFAILAFI